MATFPYIIPQVLESSFIADIDEFKDESIAQTWVRPMGFINSVRESFTVTFTLNLLQKIDAIAFINANRQFTIMRSPTESLYVRLESQELTENSKNLYTLTMKMLQVFKP